MNYSWVFMLTDYERRIKDYSIFNILEIKGIKEVSAKFRET